MMRQASRIMNPNHSSFQAIGIMYVKHDGFLVDRVSK